METLDYRAPEVKDPPRWCRASQWALACGLISICMALGGYPLRGSGYDRVKDLALISSISGLGLLLAIFSIWRVLRSQGKLRGALLAGLAGVMSLGGMVVASVQLWDML